MVRKYLNIAFGILGGLMIFSRASYAAEPGPELDLVSHISLLVFQLSIILIAAWLGGLCFTKWKLPAVLGEIIAGVIIGP
ncbi:MAG TPA: hypothetical protein PKV41_02590, partial [Candidatus Omnitrophota bacterium]|nr:hypothetical protein [Candidatus Omnitrophota bacterium]